MAVAALSVIKARKPIVGKRGEKGRFVTLKTGRVIFLPEGKRTKWADVKEKVMASKKKTHWAPGSEPESAFAKAVRESKPDEVPGEPMDRGVMNPHLLVFEDLESQGVWKAMQSEAALGHNGESEVAAYRLSRLLGSNVVPETLFYEWFGDEGTIQELVPGAVSGPYIDPARLKARKDDPDLQTMVALDVILGNADRHRGNLLIDGEGRVRAVDHGHASYAPMSDEWTRRRIARSNEVLGAIVNPDPGKVSWTADSGTFKFSEDLIDQWKTITRADFDAALEGVAEDWQPHARRQNFDNAWDNLQHIVEDGELKW